MTIMQNVVVLFVGLMFELIMYALAIGFIDEDDWLVIGSIFVNIVSFVIILLAWANGLKFPLK